MCEMFCESISLTEGYLIYRYEFMLFFDLMARLFSSSFAGKSTTINQAIRRNVLQHQLVEQHTAVSNSNLAGTNILFIPAIKHSTFIEQ
jgi:hypothetical protein